MTSRIIKYSVNKTTMKCLRKIINFFLFSRKKRNSWNKFYFSFSGPMLFSLISKNLKIKIKRKKKNVCQEQFAKGILLDDFRTIRFGSKSNWLSPSVKLQFEQFTFISKSAGQFEYFVWRRIDFRYQFYCFWWWLRV